MSGLTVLLVLGGREGLSAVPTPDQVIYGTIAIDSQAVTNSPSQGNVTVEARRAADGSLLATYRMGSQSRQGAHYYVLRVPMETGVQASIIPARPDEWIVVSVKRLDTVQFTSAAFEAVSGEARRLDFGAPTDTNGNGVPEVWETLQLGGPSADLGGDSDGDGASDGAEYLAGTKPTDPLDVLRLEVGAASLESVEVAFQGAAAEGVGYEGRKRYYALETSTDLVSWNTVSNLSRIPATNGWIIHQVPASEDGEPAVFRARVWLEP